MQTRSGGGRKGGERNQEIRINIYTLSSVQSLSRVRLSATPWTAARQASLSITSSWSLFKPMSIESVMPSILCHPLLPLPSVFPSIRVFSNQSALRIRGQKDAYTALCEIAGWWEPAPSRGRSVQRSVQRSAMTEMRGWGGETHERGDTCILTADSWCCAAGTNTTL